VNRPHRALRTALSYAIPSSGWNARPETPGHWIDDAARWRADVYACNDECGVALEAQDGPINDGIVRRSEAFLAHDVWPLWVFLRRIPVEHAKDAVLVSTDIARIPGILEALARSPSPRGLSWVDAQKPMRAAFAAAAPVAPKYPGLFEEARKKLERAAAIGALKSSRTAAYRRGWKDGWAAAAQAEPA